jgi:hypothetical protein
MDDNQQDLYISSDIPQLGTSRLWVPGRRINPISIDGPISDRVLILEKAITSPLLVPATTTAGTPEQVSSILATESPKKSQDRVFSAVSVSWSVNPADTNYAGVHIWFTGYQGNTNPTLIADGITSPFTFECEQTDETVTVTVQAFGADGSSPDFNFAPTTTVALDGVVSAPPAPSIAQGVTTTPTGLQFIFTQEAGLLADVIQCYKVYHNTVNNSSTATVYDTIPQDPSNVGGQIVVSENIPNGSLRFYWVSAVNTSGLESTKTAVSGSGTVPSGFAATGDNLVRNGDFSAGLSNWTTNALSSEIFSGVSGLPVGNCEFKSSLVKTLEADDFIPIDPNKTYLVSCWMKLANATTGAFFGGLKEYDSNKAAITHVTGGNIAAYCLFSNLTRSSGAAGSESGPSGWQYFQGVMSGPPRSPSGTPAPGFFQFATGTVYVRPFFLLNNSGTAQQVEITNIRISAVEALTQQAYLKASGTNLIANSDFVGGSSAGYNVYDNLATGNVTISVVSDATAPNATGKVLQIVTAAGTTPSPGLGGFFVALPVDSGTVVLGSYHKGDRLLFRLKANIPSGATIHYATNAFGDGATIQWLTSQAGRGQYLDYMCLVTPGTTGTFSSIGFFYLDTTITAPVTWKVAIFEAVDIEQSQLSNNLYQLTRQGVSTSLLTQGSMIPTQSFTITFSSTSTSITLSWSSATLFRSDGSTFVVASGSKSYTGLTASTQYHIYPYIDLINLVIAFINPSPPGTTVNSTFAVECNFDQRSGLTAMIVTTPSSGGTGGGTGGDGGGTCPHEDEPVEVLRVLDAQTGHIKEKGHRAHLVTVLRNGVETTLRVRDVLPSDGQILTIRVGDIEPKTDLLKGYSFKHQRDVYRRIKNKMIQGCAAWRIVDGHKVTPCEPIWKNGQWIPAFKAPGATIDYTVGVRVDIVVDTGTDEEHNYYLTGESPLLIHNLIVLPC